MAACEDSISNNAASVTSTNTSRIGENLAPFNPSMQPVVSTALELLQLKADDVLYELGCGDGRVMVRLIRMSGLTFFFKACMDVFLKQSWVQ